MACFLLHNFIRREMVIDPFELELEEDTATEVQDEDNNVHDYVQAVEPTAEWTQLREDIAMEMWNNF